MLALTQRVVVFDLFLSRGSVQNCAQTKKILWKKVKLFSSSSPSFSSSFDADDDGAVLCLRLNRF